MTGQEDENRVATAEEIAANRRANRMADIKAMVELRILSVANANTQASILLAGFSGALTAEEMETVARGQQWIEATKQEGRRAALALEEPNWPEIPEGVAELAARY